MYAEDQIFRSAMPPRGFPEGVFSPESFLDLQGVDEASKVLETSIGAVCAFPNEVAIHDFGQRVAQVASSALAAQFGRPLEPHEQVKYAGYYQFSYGAVTKAVWKYHTVSAYLSPETGLDEHFTLKVSWNHRSSTKKERKLERQVIRSEIARQMWGPIRFANATEIGLDDASMLPDLPRPVFTPAVK